MRILLINPPYHKVYTKVASAEGLSPPLGLAYIAAYLCRHGHTVRVIDANAQQLSLERLTEHLPAGFDLIGTTSFTPSLNSSVKVMQLAKRKFPAVKTVMGGAHITVAGKETMNKFPEIDFGVIGEGEETVLELVESLTNGRPVNDIKGIIFRKDKDVIQNERRSLIEDLDRLPFPAYDLLPMDKYRIPIHHVGFGKKLPLGPFFIIFTSRGCPANCSFCASKTIWGRKPRYRSAENVLEEIETLHRRFGVRVIDIADDIFTINKQRLHSIVNEIIARKLNIHFNCLSRVDTITLEDLEKMKKAGCYLIRYGIESGSQEILNRMHKNIVPEQAIKTFEITKKAEIACSASFIIGHPGETKLTVKKTIDLAKRLNATLTHFFMALPYPGTELFEIAKRENLIFEDMDWQYWAQFSGKGILRTKSLSREELIRLRNKAYRQLYFNPKYLWQSIRRIKTWQQLKMYVKGAIAVLSIIQTNGKNGRSK